MIDSGFERFADGTPICPGCGEAAEENGDCDNECRRNEAILAKLRRARRDANIARRVAGGGLV